METALVLPILVLLLVMALDVGRVFFGWVALQNAARIGADYVAQNAGAWDGMPTAELAKRDRYAELIEADIRTINCDLVGGAPPDPAFPNYDGVGDGYEDRDYAVVEIGCSFDLMTPLAENLVGGPIALIAHEEFAINGRIVQGTPVPPPPPPECPVGELDVPDMVTHTFEEALAMWIGAGFLEDNFNPEIISTGPPASRNNDDIVVAQTLPEGECQPDDAAITVNP